MLQELHWLPVDKRIDFKIATLTFKVLENIQPTYLSELFASACASQITALWGKELACGTKHKNQPMEGVSFSFAAPVIWNSLPEHVRNSSSLIIFRKQLKNSSFSPLKLLVQPMTDLLDFCWNWFWLLCDTTLRSDWWSFVRCLCTDNNVTDAPLVERKLTKNVLLLLLLLLLVQVLKLTGKFARFSGSREGWCI